MGEATGTFDLPESATRQRSPLRKVITLGLVAGIVLVYLALTGIIERFHERNLVTNADGEGIFQLSRGMLIITLLLAGWVVASEKRRGNLNPLAAGALMGVIAGAVLGLMSIVMGALLPGPDAPEGAVDIGEILVSVVPVLIDSILFGDKGAVTAFLILTISGGVFGALGSAMQTLPPRARRTLVTALLSTLVLSMLEPILRPIVTNLGFDITWLYLRRGLSILGAVLTFVVSGAAAWFWAGLAPAENEQETRQPATPQREEETEPRVLSGEVVVKWLGITGLVASIVIVGMTFAGTEFQGTTLLVVLAVCLVAVIGAAAAGRRRKGTGVAPPRDLQVGLVTGAIGLFIILPTIGGPNVSNIFGNVGLYILLGLGLNIVVGYAGLLDLGYVAFFATGAYTIAIFTSRASFLVVETGGGVGQLNYAETGATNFWVALPLAVIISVIAGILIGAPVLRLRGDYLAIVTLGFGEIIRTLVLSRWLERWLGGAQGIIQIEAPPPAALDLRDPERLYYLIFIFVAIAAFVSYRLVNARVGRAWAAMREDESVAESMGISVIKYKLLAFAMGAAVGSLGGAFFTAKIGSVFPSSFILIVSINVLAVIVIGGMGSIPGVMVGAFVLVGLPDLLREMAEYRYLFYGAILVAIMIARPEGLLPNVRRRQELHEKELEEEQYEERVGAEAGEPGIAMVDKDEEGS